MENTVLSSSPSSSAGGRRHGGDETKYKGVRKRKWGKWVSEIRLPNSRERIWLGSHDSPVKAARAFDAALFCLRGRHANFNFPNCPPDIPGAGSLTRQEIQLAAARFANEAPVVVRSDGGERCAEDDVSAVDWSFLDPPDPNNEGVLDFGLYSELHNYYDTMGGDLFPAPPLEDDDDVVNENEGDAYAHHSFLWNF